jgi:gliding motility-associated-like protein
VVVDVLPAAAATSNSPVCTGNPLNLTGGPAGMTSYAWTGPNGFTSNQQNPSVAGATTSLSGIYKLTVSDSNGLTDTTSLAVLVIEKPIPYAGSDQVLSNVFETQMEASLAEGETGEWSVITGSGIFQDAHSPATLITGLAEGDNAFMWTVSNGNCEASESITITIDYNLIPSVITPNGDNKNEFFVIAGEAGQVELTIFNRWGMVEYTNNDYLNDWGGRNNHGVELPDDTYFYVIKYKNGVIKKGTVLIKSE